MDLFCGVGLLCLSLEKRMKDLRACLGYEVYNQATGDARKSAGLLGFQKKQTQWKAADLSQPTLGAPINCDVAICGRNALLMRTPFFFETRDPTNSITIKELLH